MAATALSTAMHLGRSGGADELNVPHRQEHHRDYRAEHETIDAKHRKTPAGGDHHHIAGDARVPADQNRPQQVVHQADYQRTPGNQGKPLPEGGRDAAAEFR